MMYFADLHVHSKYSMATSRASDLPQLDMWAGKKGLGLVGTGDFTHPAWRRELRECLIPAEEGLYALKPGLRLNAGTLGAEAPARFVISGEISTVYKKDGKTRKAHHLILLPGLDAADSLARRLERIGSLHSDGRPVLRLDSRDLLEIALEACPDAVLIPAHVWTPHFSVLGAFSHFASIEECYGDLAGEIHAIETGLSSDPAMNWRVSALDRFTLVSNSDAHSPAKLAREANIIEGELSYPALVRAIQTGEGFHGTVEFFPEEGKYHLDGHRACGVCLEPEETRRIRGMCPVCGKPLTVGVRSRIEELADRPPDFCRAKAKPYESLLSLAELIAAAKGVSPSGKKTAALYDKMLATLGPELFILREAELDAVERVAGPLVAEGLGRLRRGEVKRRAGFDGEYGRITLA